MHDAGSGFGTIDAIAHMSRMEFEMSAAARQPVREGRCVGPVTRQGRGTAKVTCRQQEIPGAARALDRAARFMCLKRRVHAGQPASGMPSRPFSLPNPRWRGGCRLRSACARALDRSFQMPCAPRLRRAPRVQGSSRPGRFPAADSCLERPKHTGTENFFAAKGVTCKATRGQAPETQDSPHRRGLRTLQTLPSEEK